MLFFTYLKYQNTGTGTGTLEVHVASGNERGWLVTPCYGWNELFCLDTDRQLGYWLLL